MDDPARRPARLESLKAWGALTAVDVMLTWLWLGAVALLLGAEIDAEAERSRELRRGQPGCI